MTKPLIQVAVKAQKGDIFKVTTDVLAVGVFSDVSAKSLVKTLDKKLSGHVAKIQKLGDFEAKPSNSCLLYSEGKIGAKRILLVGLGKQKEVKLDVLRKAAALAATKAVDLRAKSIVLSLHSDVPSSVKLNSVKVGQAIGEGTCFGAFRYDEYITDTTKKRPTKINAVVVDSDAAVVTQLRKGVSTGIITGQAQN